jgi:hypothetical protein
MTTAQPTSRGDAERPVFLTAEWRLLAMLNYVVEPALLAPFVPAGTELDAWEDRTYLSLVGFRFLRTRVLGVPVPYHTDFDEVNLRFYVRRRAGGELRRGVVFVKEIVPRAAIAWVARKVYHENYVSLPMRHSARLPYSGRSGEVAYAWRLGERWHEITVDIAGEPALQPPDSEAGFITEHYWGYVRQPNGGTTEYRVEHPPWRVWHGVSAALTGDVLATYGERFAPVLGIQPHSAFVAEGSAVEVRMGQRIDR